MQFLVRKTTHTTGEVFLDVTRAKENEEFIVVDAENKEDAKEKVSDKIQCPRCKSWNTNHEYYYVDNEPTYIAFKCFDCDAVYGGYIEKDSDQ